jgi:Flp pilus assembly protein TadG
MRAHRSGGQALIWMTLMMPLFVSIVGLAIDGGVVLGARRELQSVADGAARAGATRLNMQLLRASGGTDVEVDPTLATDAVRGYVRDALSTGVPVSQAEPEAQIDIATRRVSVVVRARAATAFLRIVNIDSVPVQASADADVEYGIHDGKGG